MKPDRKLFVGVALILIAVAVITLMARWSIQPLILVMP
jgi:hypothetical protein